MHALHWELEKIAKKEYEESIEEMKHADKLINRISKLEGMPTLKPLNKLMIGENAPEMLESDLKLEEGSQKSLKEGNARHRTGGNPRHPVSRRHCDREPAQGGYADRRQDGNTD